MSLYWEDATKRIRKELDDPLLKVEYDPEKQEYQVLKLFHGGYQHLSLLVDGERVKLVYPTQYWAFQAGFKEWDGRVFENMKWGRPHRLKVKERLYEFHSANEKIRKGFDRETEDMGEELGKDIYQVFHPKIISYGR